MRRINIVIDPELDDRLERKAAARNTSMRRKRITDALAFDGDFAAAGLNELRP